MLHALIPAFFALFFSLTVTATHAAGLDALSTPEATSALRETLVKGADFAIASLGKTNGFLGNPQVKIPLPDSLKTAEKALRTFGMGKQADQLVDTMNHAAEKAVVEARPILLNAVKSMSISDAKTILGGGENSVTQYFKTHTSEALTVKFLPIVQKATQQLKLAEQYNHFAGKAASMGLIDAKDANLDHYVTQKAMDGLFLMIAEQEKSFRSNPLSAGTALLKKVFGAL